MGGGNACELDPKPAGKIGVGQCRCLGRWLVGARHGVDRLLHRQRHRRRVWAEQPSADLWSQVQCNAARRAKRRAQARHDRSRRRTFERIRRHLGQIHPTLHF